MSSTPIHPSRRSGRAARARTAVARLAGACAVALLAWTTAATAQGEPGGFAATPGRTLAPPPASGDLRAWLDYKARTQQFARPLEARLFYRRGLLARDSGAVDHAIHLVRGATHLDPQFLAPHLTLMGWLTIEQPSLAIAELAKLVQVGRESFVLQLAVAANAFDLLLRALLMALLVMGIALVAMRHAELRHPWEELLRRHLSPLGARVWPWALMVLPYLVGVGVVLPTLFLLCILWPVLRGRERAFVVVWAALLCALPTAGIGLKRLAHPLDVEHGPLFGIHTLHHQPPSAALEARLRDLGARHPGNPYVQFGLGWIARQAGDLETAEAAYRRANQLWPQDDRVLNNLGNVVALQGRDEDAMALYRRAVTANPNNAAAYLNLSQIHTKRFDFHAANEAISHAWALDFDLIQSAQGRTNDEGRLPFADQWLSPRSFWLAVQAGGASARGADALPPAWRDRIELSPGFGLAVVACALVGLAIGIVQARRLPLLACSNCGRVVCRRCGERRRASAYCRSCAEAVCEARAYEFARALLERHRTLTQRRGRLARTALATLVPGFGLMTLKRMASPLVMLMTAALLLMLQAPAPLSFVYEPQIGPSDDVARQALFIGWAVLYLWSILGYFMARARRDAFAKAQLENARDAMRRERRAAAPPPAAAAA